jgi:hypothetical protein
MVSAIAVAVTEGTKNAVAAALTSWLAGGAEDRMTTRGGSLARTPVTVGTRNGARASASSRAVG